MALFFEGGEPFASGSQAYLSGPIGPTDPSNRLIIEIEIGEFTTSAVIDTGSPYVVIDPRIAESIGIESSSALQPSILSIRGIRTTGFLHRINLTIRADLGEEITVDSTVFVPELEGQEWGLPCFIGWTGCLERLSFAIDPHDERFYFGGCP